MHKFISILFPFFILFALSSCATLESKKDAPAVLILVQNRSDQPVYHQGSLLLSEITKPLKFTVSAPYVLVKTPNPGNYTTREYTWQNGSAKKIAHPLIKFSSETGVISVFPEKLVCYTSGSSKFEKLTQEDIKTLEELITAKDPFDGAQVIMPKAAE